MPVRPKRLSRSERRNAPATGAARRLGGLEAPGLLTPTAGVVVRHGKHLEVEPLFQKGTALLLGREGQKAAAGNVVLYTFSHGRRAKIIRVIGEKSEIRDVMEALLLDSLQERGFHERVLAEAADAAQGEARRDEGRADLRRLFTFTIDPETARDFDDALSFEPAGDDAIRLYVHIADVSYFVRPGRAVDVEALRRGTSVYVPTGVEPMLPPQLSANVCSLQPGVDRKAVTVEMVVGRDGQVRTSDFYRSLIRSDERLEYDQVERMFKGGERMSPKLSEALALGRPLARALRERRDKAGKINVYSVEPDFHWNDGELVRAHPAESLESHEFIEDFMVLANEQVASFLEKRRVPTVYRVHDLPDPFHLDHLFDTLASLDLPTPVFDPMTATPNDIRRATIEVADWVDRFTPKGRGKAALMSQVLRSQARAVYQTKNIGHFGLASKAYCHFTSPIRRYPDLLVHRALLGELELEPKPTTYALSDWAEHCSQTERGACRIELRGDDIALAYLLAARLRREGPDLAFRGQIMSFVRSGAFVLFEELYEGFLSARDLPGDYYQLDESETAMVGRHTGIAYRLADPVTIQIKGIDEARGKIDLVIAEEPKSK